jgi:predicted nucleic acid-binding protein
MNATEGAFLDTNVLVYALSGDPAKADRAESILQRGGTISTQVLVEFVDVVRRKHDVAWDGVLDAVDLILSLCSVVETDVETFMLAVELSRRHRIRIFDGMILASAILSGARTLLSEDMQDGRVVESVTIRNPFAGL